MYMFKRPPPPNQQDGASEAAVAAAVDAPPAAQRRATAAGLLGVAGKRNSSSNSSRNRRLQVVFGPDSRREVLDVPSFPLSAQGYLQFGFVDSDGVEWRHTCTAGLVGPAVILTAAHCFYSRELRTFHVNAMFNPGRWRGGRSQAWANVTRGLIHRAFVTSRDASGAAQHDIALLVLDAPLGLTVGWLGLCTARSGVAAGLAMAGYPTDKAAGSLWYTPPAACRVRSRGDDSLLTHTCDTSTGMSGTNMFQQLLFNSSDAAVGGSSTSGGTTCVWGEPPPAQAQTPGDTEADSPISLTEVGAGPGSNGTSDSAPDPPDGSAAEGPGGGGGVSGGDAAEEPDEVLSGWFVRAVHGSGSEAGGENLGVKINSR